MKVHIVYNFFFSAFYGVIFSDQQEAAFSNYRLWESLGFVISFAYGDYLCVNVKLYILVVVLVIGVSLYAVIEVMRMKEESLNVVIALKPNHGEDKE